MSPGARTGASRQEFKGDRHDRRHPSRRQPHRQPRNRAGARPLVASPGDRRKLRIVDLEGQQAVDFLCYSADLPLDRINLPNTIKLNKSLYITKGCKIYSDHAKVLFTVVEDTCGFHDTLAGCCSNEIDLVRYNVVKTQSCRANFIAELATWSMGPSEIVPNINFFMRVPFKEDGHVVIADGVSKPGDYVDLLAEQPVWRCCRIARKNTILRPAPSRHRSKSSSTRRTTLMQAAGVRRD